ncbi:MAG: 16S rRNA (adenine(1518)-N(6)/adenine(1519)-N(6))-dimethyltransferase RsmA [Bacteroidota bacterium]
MNKILKINNKPLKKFGQNYLIDNNLIRKFVNEFNPQIDEKIIEIGPGRGSITSELSNKTKFLTAIEIDDRMIASLSENFPKVNFINKDILKINFSEILDLDLKYRVIGNIPFNLTSSIFFKLIEYRNYFLDALFIIQLDVAKRITAKPNSKEYSILSVLLNYFFDVSIKFEISPNVFYPKPKVKSSAIHLIFDKYIDETINNDLFIQIVKASFGNRRKTLKNSLNNSIFKSYNLSGIDIDLSRRAETLTIDEYVKLTRFIQKQK